LISFNQSNSEAYSVPDKNWR